MVAHRTLTPFVRVRILHPLPKNQSSHPGRLIFFASGKDSNNQIGKNQRKRAEFSSAKKTVRWTVFRNSTHTSRRTFTRCQKISRPIRDGWFFSPAARIRIIKSAKTNAKEPNFPPQRKQSGGLFSVIPPIPHAEPSPAANNKKASYLLRYGAFPLFSMLCGIFIFSYMILELSHLNAP